MSSGPLAPPFQQRMPWIGGDLQTLRDTLRPPQLPLDQGESVPIALGDGGELLALHDRVDQNGHTHPAILGISG